jgi:preprotein translocase subunit SecE
MNKIQQVITQVRTFFAEVQAELKKCSWPSRSELFESTVVVVVSVLIVGVFVGVSDVVLMGMMKLIIR